MTFFLFKGSLCKRCDQTSYFHFQFNRDFFKKRTLEHHLMENHAYLNVYFDVSVSMCLLCFYVCFFNLLFSTPAPYLLCYVRLLVRQEERCGKRLTSLHASVSTPVFTDHHSGKLPRCISLWLSSSSSRSTVYFLQRYLP